MIDAFALQPHFVDHLAPIWLGLPDELRGRFDAHGLAAARARAYGIRVERLHPGTPSEVAPLTLVASHRDEQMVRPRPVVLVEHGCGQSYGHDPSVAHNPAYPGGSDRDGVVLFICPNEQTAARWGDMYPDTPCAVVGTAKLDFWHEVVRSGGMLGSSAPTGVVLEALLTMAATRFADGRADRRGSLDAGTIFGLDGIHAGRMLELAGISYEEWLRAVSDRRPDTTGTSRGVVAGEGGMAEEAGPQVPQRGSDLSGRSVRTPGMRGRDAPGRGDAEGEPAAVAAHGPGRRVQARSRVDVREHLRDDAREAAMSDVPEDAAGAGRALMLPLVVFTFHHDCIVVPECGWAWDYYAPELRRLAAMGDEERGWRMAGHAHPRAPELLDWWRSIGVRPIVHSDEVMDEADLLAFDNTSLGFEFASTDRPVVVLNRPEYRRDVHHGGRFWDWAQVGLEVDDPPDLAASIEIALRDDGDQREYRRQIVSEVYAYADGHATERAVAAIVADYEAGHWRAWRENRQPHNPKGPPQGPRLDPQVVEVVRRMRAAGRSLSAEAADGLHRATPADLTRLLADLG